MRRVLGPILTTGVALVTAGVVVANPIVAPRADVQIPAVQLSSGNDDVGGMLDPAFLDAIAPGPTGSDNPFSVLKQLISSFASDATSLGTNAIVDAFVAGVAAVSEPELTAASIPYAGPPIDLPALTEAPIPGFYLDPPVPSMPNVPAALSAATSIVTSSVAPVVQDFVTGLVADAGYVGGGIVEAAFALGAVVAAEPRLIAATLAALVNGDFHGALTNAVKVVVAPLGPPTIIFNTLRTVVESHLAQLSGFVSALAVPAVPAVPAVSPPAAIPVTTTPSVDAAAPATKPFSGRESRRDPRDPTLLPSSGAASVRRSAANIGGPAAQGRVSGLPGGSIARGPIAVIRDAVTAISEQAGIDVAEVADTVGKATGRSRGAAATGTRS